MTAAEGALLRQTNLGLLYKEKDAIATYISNKKCLLGGKYCGGM